MSGERFIGIDVGGTKVVSAVLEDGEFHTHGARPDPDRQPPTRCSSRCSPQIEALRGAGAGRRASALPSIVEWSTGRVRHSVNLPFRDVPLRKLLVRAHGHPGLRRERRVVRRAGRGVRRRPDRGREPRDAHGRHGVGGGLVLGGGLYRSATSAGRDGPHDDRARPGRRRARRARPVPAARVAGDARRPAPSWTGWRAIRRASIRSRSSAAGSPRATTSPATTPSRAPRTATCTAST